MIGSGKAAHIKRQHGLTLAESVFYVLRYIRAPLGEADHVVEQLSQSLSGIHPLRRFFVIERRVVHYLVPFPVRKSANALNLLHKISNPNHARLRNLRVDAAQMNLSS